MFEMMDPSDEAEVWADFVPPVPPTDDEVIDVDDLDGWSGLDEFEDGVEGEGYGELPDLDSAGALALAEFEQALEAERLAGLDAAGVLSEAAGTKQVERRVQAKQLWLAMRWADLHAVLTRPGAVGKGRERLVRLGGDGTPEVAEFAAAELGAVLAMTDGAAKSLIGDGLDLRHRFPLLWRRVQDGWVEVWLARRIVQEARPLTVEAAAAVDARIADLAGGLTWRRLKAIVAAAILAADPAKAADDAQEAASGVGVFPDPESKDGYQGIFIKARAGDVTAFDAAVDLIARALKTIGDTRPVQQRRASAVGILADPAAAHDLIAEAERVRNVQSQAAAARRAGDMEAAEQLAADAARRCPPGWRCGRQSPFTFGTAVLYYHLTRETLEAMLAGQPYAGAGVVRVEDIGPVILDQVKEWLGHANVVLKPVIDLAGIQPVDHYETPPKTSEAIRLIRTVDYFPYGTSTSRHQDCEHTERFVPMNRGGRRPQTGHCTTLRTDRRPNLYPPQSVTGSKPMAAGPSPNSDPAPGCSDRRTGTTSSSTNTAPPH